MKKGFTLVELLVSITIIGILASIGLNTFSSAQMKSRDTKRKAHLKQLVDALEAYQNDKNKYPESDNGQILGCGAGAEEVCTWGESVWQNTTTGTVYMIKMPGDPTLGLSYYYEALDDGRKFQIYCRLENTKDISVHKDADDISQVYQGLNCGTKLCNYGVTSTNITPETGRTLVVE